jgi:preprotein translocase subunit SecG
MQVFHNALVVLQMVAALVMIGLVLIQHGKGADMGASFGSGASGSLFGATGSANFLSRTTAVCAAVFFGSTLALAFISNDRTRETGGSALDRPAVSAPAASAPPATGATQIPGTAPMPAAPVPAPAAAVPVPTAPAPAASGVGAIPTK